jgi:ATP-dependent HslUV protease ATP-binding subunit HslU
MEEMAEQLRGMFSHMGQEKRKTRKLKIAEALKLLTDEEAAKMVNEEDVKTAPLPMPSKTALSSSTKSTRWRRARKPVAPMYRVRVQRDLLPLVEGTSVSTKYGVVKTDHILFIASGAFHLSKPSDLIPELQGRFPIRVELESLSVQDFEAILMQTHASLVKQYQALLATEGVTGVQARGHHASGNDCL